MNRLLGIAILLVLIAGCGAEESPWTTHELGTDAEFQDILFQDAHNGWIVGGQPGITGGVIGRTDDGGITWRFQSGLVAVSKRTSLFHFHSIHFMDATHACMVGTGGVIARSQDGGEHWKVVRRGGPASRLFDVDFIDDKHGWAVGWSPVLATEDGGQTWWPRGEEKVYGHAIRFLNANDGWIAGQHGSLYRTRDGGITWRRFENLDLRDKPYLFAMDFVDSMHGWIVGEHGTILRTGDAGETWSHQESGMDAFLTAVSFVDTLEGWTVGFNRETGTSCILHTTDGGSVWDREVEVWGEELRAIQMMKGKGWAVGDRSRTDPQRILLFNDMSPATMEANLDQ